MSDTVSTGTGFGFCVRCGVALMNGCIVTNAGNECGMCLPLTPEGLSRVIAIGPCWMCETANERAAKAEARAEAAEKRVERLEGIMVRLLSYVLAHHPYAEEWPVAQEARAALLEGKDKP